MKNKDKTSMIATETQRSPSGKRLRSLRLCVSVANFYPAPMRQLHQRFRVQAIVDGFGEFAGVEGFLQKVGAFEQREGLREFVRVVAAGVDHLELRLAGHQLPRQVPAGQSLRHYHIGQ